MQPVEPAPGAVLRIAEAASVQFAGGNAITFRVIRVDVRQTYHGWVWLVGYQLNAKGEAVERREIFVQRDGLFPAQVPTPRQRSGHPRT